MIERRRWKADEKLAIIKEVKENGKVVETCRKYSVDPSMYYKWKESYEKFGLDGLKPHYRRMEPGIRKIIERKSSTVLHMNCVPLSLLIRIAEMFSGPLRSSAKTIVSFTSLPVQ